MTENVELLIARLTFIHHKKSWGFVFRFGFFEIPKEDSETISKSRKKKLNNLLSENLLNHAENPHSIGFQ